MRSRCCSHEVFSPGKVAKGWYWASMSVRSFCWVARHLPRATPIVRSNTSRLQIIRRKASMRRGIFWPTAAILSSGLEKPGSAAGDAARATLHWQNAERQRGDFQQMQVRAVSEMTYWSAMALRRLGRKKEATSLFVSILDYATELKRKTPKIDYFATSLPTMLLFEEELRKRQHITATFLQAQALTGLGLDTEAQAALDEVQRLDRSHAGARDMLVDKLAGRTGG